MAYNRIQYRRDIGRFWRDLKPSLRRGLISPIRAGFDLTRFPKELGAWMRMVLSIFRFFVRFAFSSVRLALGR